MKDLFGKIFKNDETHETPTATEIKSAEQKEWIWVEGYKGTNLFMTCRDYQFELGKRYDIPEDEDIIECANGFHLCLKLDDVFGYYPISDNNRFFKVKALVRKSDVEQYGTWENDAFWAHRKKDKLVSKSIEFISECTADEILSGYITENWTDDDIQRALVIGPENVEHNITHRTRVNELVNLGYSVPFSEYIANNDDKFTKACVVASQSDVSMDVKVLTIFCGN